MQLWVKNLDIFGVHRKFRLLGGCHEKPILWGGGFPKKGGEVWTVCQYKGRGRCLARKRGVVFSRGGVSAHYVKDFHDHNLQLF